MSVTVENPWPDCPDEESILENCSACRRPCNTWFLPKDVALCSECAEIVSEEDIPSKLDWILKEQLLDDD
jgi:hypothetical protein